LTLTHETRRSLRAVEWLNFFLVDVQTGLGPFLAAYLAASAWNPAKVGYALTFGGLVTVAIRTPAGAVVDATRRLWRAPAARSADRHNCLCSPTLDRGRRAIPRAKLGRHHPRHGRSENLRQAVRTKSGIQLRRKRLYRPPHRRRQLQVRIPPHLCGSHWQFPPSFRSPLFDANQIDYAKSRGGAVDGTAQKVEGLSSLLKDRVLLLFLITAFLFHLANAANAAEIVITTWVTMMQADIG
jgi:hypothetical protein